MDPLSALAIAAAVAQFLDFGGRLFTTILQESEGPNASKKAALANLSVRLNSLIAVLDGAMADDISRPNEARPNATPFLPSNKSQDVAPEYNLVAILEECKKLARRLARFVDLLEARDGATTGAQFTWAALAAKAARFNFGGRWKGRPVDELIAEVERLQKRVMDAVLLEQWFVPPIQQMRVYLLVPRYLLGFRQSTRTSNKREVHFSNQLAEILNLCKRVDHCVAQRGRGMVNNDLSAEVRAIEEVTDFELLQPHGIQPQTGVTPIAPRIQTLLQAGENLSLTGLGGSIVDILGRGSRPAANLITSELQTVLWMPDWTLDSSMANTEPFQPEIIRAVASTVVRGLEFEAFQARKAAIADSVLQTYSWIYDRADTRPGGEALKWSCFPEWLEAPGQTTYWITGKPGSGKSTIMKYIQRNPALSVHLSKWARHLPLLLASYYAWNAGTTPQKSFKGLQRTLLCQALQMKPKLILILAPRLWAFFRITGAVPATHNWPDWEIDQSFEALLAESGKTLRLAIFIDGLDEFDIPPKKVVQIVNSITSSSQDGVKVCVASRPWVEFDDAYRDVPQLEMNLHTSDDMEIFVSEYFRSCRAFTELKGIYPKQANQLLRDIVHKANGVFIWLRVVVEALVESATEGTGIMELQAILDSLPSDMCDLYDAIWARTPDQARNRGAILLRLVKEVGRWWSLDWLTIWLADEFAALAPDRMLTVDLSSFEDGQTSVESMKLSLRRKLASRTRGLLELGEAGHVGFAHRTTSEWVAHSKVWDDICARCAHGFDPYLCFVQLSTLRMSSTKLWTPARDSILDAVRRTFYSASRVSSENAEALEVLVRTLDCFDKRVEKAAELVAWPLFNDIRWDPSLGHWSSMYHAQENLVMNSRSPMIPFLRKQTLIGLAAHFAVLPYLKSKVLFDPWSVFQRGTSSTVGILEAAIFPPRMYKPWNMDPCVDSSNRIDTIRFLYEIGVEQKYFFVNKTHKRSLRQEVRAMMIGCKDRRDEQTGLSERDTAKLNYYTEVEKILGKARTRTTLRSASMRLKAFRSLI